MVPKSCWYSNVRSSVPREMWDRLRKLVYAEYDHKCGVCGAKGRLEAHEIWDYQMPEKIQKLVGMIALCPQCHQIKHYGLSEIRASKGELDLNKLIVHFCEVNDCDMNAFLAHKAESVKTWFNRSKIEWTLDITHLDKYQTKDKRSDKPQGRNN